MRISRARLEQFCLEMGMQQINILGTVYRIDVSSPELDPRLKGLSGYIDHTSHIICLNGYLREADQENRIDDFRVFICDTLKHEVIHGFLYQSGLDCDSSSVINWAKNEEMIDWMALQLDKMYDTLHGVIDKVYAKTAPKLTQDYDTSDPNRYRGEALCKD